MSENIAEFNSLFNVPDKSLGSLIMAQIADRLNDGPFHVEQEFWPEVKGWLVGRMGSPDPEVDVFGARRSDFTRHLVAHCLNQSGPSKRIAYAMAGVQILAMREGPSAASGIKFLPLMFVLDVIAESGSKLTPENIILIMSDFMACGCAMEALLEEAQ